MPIITIILSQPWEERFFVLFRLVLVELGWCYESMKFHVLLNVLSSIAEADASDLATEHTESGMYV